MNPRVACAECTAWLVLHHSRSKIIDRLLRAATDLDRRKLRRTTEVLVDPQMHEVAGPHFHLHKVVDACNNLRLVAHGLELCEHAIPSLSLSLRLGFSPQWGNKVANFVVGWILVPSATTDAGLFLWRSFHNR